MLVHLTKTNSPGVSVKMSPIPVCLKGLKDVGDAGAKLLCLSKTKKPNIRYTHMEGPVDGGWMLEEQAM